MSEMSPLASVLMRVLRAGSLASAALLVLFIGIAIWQRIGTTGDISLLKQDTGFLGVLAALVLFALYIARSITRELGKST